MAASDRRPARLSRGSLLAVCALLAVLAGLLWLTLRPDANPPARLSPVDVARRLAEARAHLAAQRWDAAASAADDILTASSDHPGALLVAGESAFQRQQYREALQFYARVPASAPEHPVALLAAAEIQRTQGSFEAAEVLYRRVLDMEPQHATALERMAALLKLTARHAEAVEFLQRLLAMKAVQVEQLQWLADPDHPLRGEAVLRRTLELVPNQVLPQLGLAELMLVDGDAAGARQLTTELRLKRPQVPAIESLYARCLWETGDVSAMEVWQSGLSDAVLERADIWHWLGLMQEARDSSAAACRCFLECLRRDPNHAAAAHRAGRLLAAGPHEPQGRDLLRRGEQLAEVVSLAGRIRPNQPDGGVCRQLAERLEELGRIWEAYGWAALAARDSTVDTAWMQQTMQRLETQLPLRTPFDRDPVVHGFAELLSQFPLPSQGTASAPAQATSGRHAALSFVDESVQVGLEFTYFEDPDPALEGRRMPEFTGGGVAVLDYDLDGWPDVYFTQGAGLAASQPAVVHLDQLFRNLGNGRFARVTENSRIGEDGFSQGVAAGDFNNDGFPDLYVANLGRNRLFENRGDGTFEEVPIPEYGAWTTSCAIADVNLDGIPDLYDVNYVQGPDLLDRRCPTPAGLRVCTPHAFEAAPDRLLLGQGDGTFQDHSVAAGINPPVGKGLGLLIGPLGGGDSPLSIFVANDTEANYLLLNRQPPGAPPAYEDAALVSGVAYGHDGRAQACMGVAAADFDHNGRLDLFVTNYFNESNAYYVQLAPGSFDDQAQQAGLRQPSWALLGFGTQALDADLDGHPDLVVTNGDLDDFTHVPRAFRMRPQIFVNDGTGRFTEPGATPPGDYFAPGAAYRGRGLAWLDWNRDGRPDFVVCHLDEPSALVTNRTVTEGGFVSVKLIGTSSSRDAVGAQVNLVSQSPSGRKWFGWLTAGDGYQASNERGRLLFGVGQDAGPFVIEIRWPAGTVTRHSGAGRESAIVCLETGRTEREAWLQRH
jgi:tetratricopeptide (TPR) repeat protein